MSNKRFWKSIDKLKLVNNDILVFRLPKDYNDDQMNEAETTMRQIHGYLASKGLDILCLSMPEDMKLSVLKEEQMKQEGWVKIRSGGNV